MLRPPHVHISPACQVIIGGTVWDLRMPSVILQHVETLSNAHIVATADPGVSIAYTLDARSQVPHEPGLQRHVQVRRRPYYSQC